MEYPTEEWPLEELTPQSVTEVQDGGGVEAKQGEGWRARSLWRWRTWRLRSKRSNEQKGGGAGGAEEHQGGAEDHHR